MACPSSTDRTGGKRAHGAGGAGGMAVEAVRARRGRACASGCAWRTANSNATSTRASRRCVTSSTWSSIRTSSPIERAVMASRSRIRRLCSANSEPSRRGRIFSSAAGRHSKGCLNPKENGAIPTTCGPFSCSANTRNSRWRMRISTALCVACYTTTAPQWDLWGHFSQIGAIGEGQALRLTRIDALEQARNPDPVAARSLGRVGRAKSAAWKHSRPNNWTPSPRSIAPKPPIAPGSTTPKQARPCESLKRP